MLNVEGMLAKMLEVGQNERCESGQWMLQRTQDIRQDVEQDVGQEAGRLTQDAAGDTERVSLEQKLSVSRFLSSTSVPCSWIIQKMVFSLLKAFGGIAGSSGGLFAVSG